MSQSSGAEFDLPDEVLAVMPTDPFEQLDLARKITSIAIASRVSNLDSEVGSLRLKLMEKDRAVAELEHKLHQLQLAYEETDSRLKIAHDDKMKLTKERDSLTATTKKLSRDLAKLETFKRQLMQSLNDENSTPSETVDIVTYDQSSPKSIPNKAEETHDSLSDSARSGYSTNNASKQAVQKTSKTPRFTPTGTPKILSTRASPKRYSVASSPKGISRKSSPTKAAASSRGISRKSSPTKGDYERHGSLSSWLPSSQQSSAANSPPRGRPLPARGPKIDGKEFFRQARSRLSYEQFSAFLANVKELNAQKQSREDTLRKAEEIFGNDNKDLYLLFQGLLSRNMR